MVDSAWKLLALHRNPLAAEPCYVETQKTLIHLGGAEAWLSNARAGKCAIGKCSVEKAR